MENCTLSSWKTALLTACLGMVLHGVSAQSTNLSVRTYDTVLTGPGYGTYHISFPKWNTDSGLLVSVRISATVNLQYSYSLKNTDVITGTYGLWVGREDYYTSPALTAAYDNINEQKIGTYTLNPGEQATQAPFSFLSSYANTDSITGSTAPFLGAGTVSFTYYPITYTNIRSSNNASYGYHATALETTHFSISYLYSTGDVVLATDLSSFTAVLREPSSVQLNWSTAAEQQDRTYEIQRSGDGHTFTTIGYKVAEAASGPVSYSYMDRLDAPASGTGNDGVATGTGSGSSDGGKWYYRLRLVHAGGVTYSTVRTVTMPSDAAGRLVLFPNPTVDHINLLMPGDPNAPGDWLVNIRAADGRLVQSATFYHSNNLPIFFHQNLSPGIYFAQVMDSQGRNGRVTSFRVDRR
ncbi:MAG TPA: T9SS type A sorting domain-containing protein [Puia sp.]|nr:T9SS type A sorting domain-containing protein [Puia sp.]